MAKPVSLSARSCSSSPSSSLSQRRLRRGQVIVNYEDSVYQTVQTLLANGCSATQISFSNPISTGANGGSDPYANPNAPSDYSCNVFDPRGGRLIYMLPPAAALNTLMSANTGYGYYYFTGTLAIENIGNWSNNTPDLIMSLPYVNATVANEINSLIGLQTGLNGNQLCNTPYQTTGYFKGTYAMPCSNAPGSYDMYYAPNVIGSPQGCIWRSDSTHTNGIISTYIFDCYHVLIVQ
jgi:hypothetical protein